MSKYNQSNFAILVTSVSASTVFNDISDYVTDFSGLNLEAVLQQSDAFGDSWREMLYTGIRQAADITIKGFYDDAAATGPHALMGALSALGAERRMKLKFGTTNEYPKICLLYTSDAADE